MRGRRYRLYLSILTAVIILMALAAESVYLSDFEYRVRTKKFNRILSEKETITEDCLNSLKVFLDKGEDIGSITKNNLFSVIEQQGITLLDYVDRKLVYWSDNNYNVPHVLLDDSLFVRPLRFIQNGWFITKSFQSGNEKIIALLRIRNDYGFKNSLVKSGFVKDFNVPENTEFTFDKNISGFHVNNKKGDFLFSLVFPEVRKSSYFIIGPVVLWICSIILILLLIFKFIAWLAEKRRYYLAVCTGFLIFVVLYLALLYSGKPAVFFRTGLFSAFIFTLNSIIPSLGHLLLFSVFLFAVTYIIYKYFPISERSGKNPAGDFLFLTLLLILGAVLFFFFHKTLEQLISNSNIGFEAYKVLDITVYSVLGFCSILLLVLSSVFFLLKVFSATRKFRSGTIIISLVISLLVLSFAVRNSFADDFILVIFYLIITLSLWLTQKRKLSKFNMTVVFSLIFGLYSVYYIIILTEKKTTENIKVLAVSHSSENDPEAEHLLLDLWPEISSDSTLKGMLSNELSGQDEVEKIRLYLHETYFNGYWGNFYLSVVKCRNDSPLLIASESNMVESCFEFFNERIRKNGHKLTGTEFYFLDDQGGRSCYVGRLFNNLDENLTNGLFIELYGDVGSFQSGYPELLLDKKYQGYVRLKEYSFAKYINGNLVLRTGEFPFNKTDAAYIDKGSDYRIFQMEGFRHVLYKNGNITVLISRPELKVVDVIISFAYLFAFILLVSNIIVLLIKHPDIKSLYNFNIRQKLQISFVTVLLLSFVSIGVIIAFFSIRQFQSKHNENIREKLNSIYIELDSRLATERYLTPDWRDDRNSSLNELLIKLSNVFNTDINLYDLNGFLIATSRPEVFYRDLTSKRLNMLALINLKDLTKSEHIQKEKIGSLEYISAYVPFYNREDQLLAYLNLPYFRAQSVLAREISNLIVAVINFTLLLTVIIMSLAVFISGRLTSPLKMLSEGLASVGLGKKSKHLSYKGHDEIGEMVRQYNRMVDEIEESAIKLANSEREYAWREMAKQIAHEIKNPLTPMQLNIQQLYKSWKDGIPGFEKKLERFTKNQIEYIENLSSIASAFSSFAKMPGANPTEVDLLEQIKMTLELFKNTANLTFRVNWPHENKIIVFADKEHLNGIFSNLIKNGIQSVPAGREGIIKINLTLKGDKVVVSVIDNGAGIPEGLKKNLFIPNFTTKSSGTGLGLSIAKRYVENANGRIWFESDINNGSVFYVELPLKYTVERLG